MDASAQAVASPIIMQHGHINKALRWQDDAL
jgi:hypothetical protein